MKIAFRRHRGIGVVIGIYAGVAAGIMIAKSAHAEEPETYKRMILICRSDHEARTANCKVKEQATIQTDYGTCMNTGYAIQKYDNTWARLAPDTVVIVDFWCDKINQ